LFTLTREGPRRLASSLLSACLCALSASAVSFPPPDVLAAQAPAPTDSSAPAPAAKKPAPSTHKPKKKTAASTRRQQAPDPSRIREIQQALAREGFYKDDPTGKWDAPSIDAMKQFQQSKGLTATGKIEALSLQKLGLGSPVSGIAAPDPQPPPPPPAPSGAPSRP